MHSNTICRFDSQPRSGPARWRAIPFLLCAVLGCSGYLTGGPAKEVCFTVRIDFGGTAFVEEMTVVKVLDLSTGQAVFARAASAWFFNRDGALDSIGFLKDCVATSSTGTKKVIAFYHPGENDTRPECSPGGNIASSLCMPGPGDVVAETYVDIADGDDLTIEMTMAGVKP